MLDWSSRGWHKNKISCTRNLLGEIPLTKEEGVGIGRQKPSHSDDNLTTCEGREAMDWAERDSVTQFWRNLGQTIGESLSKTWTLEESCLRQKWTSTSTIPQSLTGNSLGKNVVMDLKRQQLGLSVSCAPHIGFSSRRSEQRTSMAVINHGLRIHERKGVNYLWKESYQTLLIEQDENKYKNISFLWYWMNQCNKDVCSF